MLALVGTALAFAPVAAPPRALACHARACVPLLAIPQLEDRSSQLAPLLPHPESHPPLSVDPLPVDEELAEDMSDALLVTSSLIALSTAFSLLHASPVEAAAAAPMAAAAAPSASAIFEKAAKRALGGGVSGALAGVSQVILLMWLRTTMNYQYRNGGGTADAMKALYEEGGPARFYRGVGFALFQTPLSRFGDTAANSGVLALLAASDLPIGVRTACASAAASIWRIGLYARATNPAQRCGGLALTTHGMVARVCSAQDAARHDEDDVASAREGWLRSSSRQGQGGGHTGALPGRARQRSRLLRWELSVVPDLQHAR